MKDGEWRLELRNGSGSARNHCRVGCGGRHSRRGGSKALAKENRDAQ